MITPEQIKEKTFEKVAFGGYNVAEVNAFMLKVAEEYQELCTRSETLTDKMKVLVKTIEKYRDD